MDVGGSGKGEEYERPLLRRGSEELIVESRLIGRESTTPQTELVSTKGVAGGLRDHGLRQLPAVI